MKYKQAVAIHESTRPFWKWWIFEVIFRSRIWLFVFTLTFFSCWRRKDVYSTSGHNKTGHLSYKPKQKLNQNVMSCVRPLQSGIFFTSCFDVKGCQGNESEENVVIRTCEVSRASCFVIGRGSDVSPLPNKGKTLNQSRDAPKRPKQQFLRQKATSCRRPSSIWICYYLFYHN